MSQNKLRFFRAAALPTEAQVGDIYFIYEGVPTIYIYKGGEEPWEAYTGGEEGITLNDVLTAEIGELSTTSKTLVSAINEINNSKYPIRLLETGGAYIDPGVYNVWLSGSAPEVIDFQNVSGIKANEYIVRFGITSSMTVPQISFEYNITWANNDVPTWSKGWEYEVTIVIANGIGLASYLKFPLS